MTYKTSLNFVVMKFFSYIEGEPVPISELIDAPGFGPRVCPVLV